MAAKSISISMPESMAWKLEQLENSHGIPRSSLIQKALLLLIAEMQGFHIFGQIGGAIGIDDIEAEYVIAKKGNS